MGEFGFEIEQDVRYRDLDTMGHVNNAVIATYLERARLEYLREVAELSIEETGFTIANIEIDFRRPVEWQDSVTVGVRVPSIGSTSIPLEYEVRTGSEVAATGGDDASPGRRGDRRARADPRRPARADRRVRGPLSGGRVFAGPTPRVGYATRRVTAEPARGLD